MNTASEKSAIGSRLHETWNYPFMEAILNRWHRFSMGHHQWRPDLSELS
jgi:hypothetical protein